MRPQVLFILSILLASSISGCFGESAVESGQDASNQTYPQPWERSELSYQDTDVFARVSINGSYAIGEVASVFVPVPTITAADGGAGLTGDAQVHLGLWLPVIEGCDFTSANL